jgi:NAD(P)-dependent dehydrogenase (short-subunit alcohol dehydrogenase family)
VGPFLLTVLLALLLREQANARVVWVSSGGMYAEPLSVARLEMGPGVYNGTPAYARAKRAQVTLA